MMIRRNTPTPQPLFTQTKANVWLGPVYDHACDAGYTHVILHSNLQFLIYYIWNPVKKISKRAHPWLIFQC